MKFLDYGAMMQHSPLITSILLDYICLCASAFPPCKRKHARFHCGLGSIPNASNPEVVSGFATVNYPIADFAKSNTYNISGRFFATSHDLTQRVAEEGKSHYFREI